MPSAPLPTPHRYLWAQGSLAAPLPAGTILAGRYQVIQYPLVQDTTPDEPPTPLEVVPSSATPYLAMSRFTIAIPRPFTQVMAPDHQTPLLLLEEIPVQMAAEEATIPTLLPSLPERWEQATALQQLTWLWRLAKLWQPCLANDVAHSLLDWQNIRVDDEDVRLLSLETQAAPPTLVDLGQQWQPLAAIAAPPIRPYLTQLTDQMSAGRGTPEGLVDSLIQAIETASPQQTVTVQLSTYSDQGPTRQRNEDACYPESGFAGQANVAVATADVAAAPLVVVCDGVGGHQGGDVASQLAIAEVTQRLGPITATANAPHREVVTALKQAIHAANQLIAEHNDAHQRQDRDRMGTTIVIALVYGVRLYIAHLGDSRAYRVRSHNCRQLTLDDDVATREMRLGLGLYQDALQNPGSGALIQALGMANSSHLRPTVRLYPITTNSLFLLCSDGLSDNDLVNRLWPTELRPTLLGDRDVATAGKRLIELANTYNGHDNVTVALLKLLPHQVLPTPAVPVEVATLLLTSPPPTTELAPTVPNAAAVTQHLPPATSSPKLRPVPLVLTSILIAALVGGVGALSWQWFARRSTNPSSSPPPSETGEILSPSAPPPHASGTNSASALAVGDYLQIRQLPDPSAAATMLDAESPPVPDPPAAIDLPERLLAVGSIVQVISRQKTPDDQLWVRLQVCSVATAEPAEEIPPTPSASSTGNDEVAEVEPRDRVIPLAQPGDQGWLLEKDLPIFADRLSETSDTQRGGCID